MHLHLATAALNHITENPSQWNQGVWIDTLTDVACFGGRSVMLSGQFSIKQMRFVPYRLRSNERMFEASRDVLGLSTPEAYYLFHEVMTRDVMDLWRAVKSIDSRIEMPVHIIAKIAA